MFPKTEVREHRGAPAMWIEGKPVFPLIFMTTADGLDELHKLGFEGSHLYTDEYQLGWEGIGRHDFAGFDAQFLRALEADPKAYVVPRIMLHAPEDWMNRYPDELVAYADPEGMDDKSWGGPRRPSWASDRWKQDAAAALSMLITHVNKGPFAEHIIGWHIGAGVFGEWHYPNPVHYPDISPVFVKAFESWLRQRYPHQSPPPRIPTIAERRAASHGMFRHPVQDRWMLDHAEFFHSLGAAALELFAGVVKKESDGRCLVVAFNGYLPDLGVSHEADHRSFSQSLRSRNIDVFSSPHSYRRRRPGEDASMRGFMGSVRAMGRLWVSEGDDRTSRAANTWQAKFTHVKTMEESAEILWRAFAQALTHNAGLWFMDQGALWDKKPELHFYNDPLIVKAFEQMGRVAAESMDRPRTRSAEVAVVCDYHSALYCADPGFGGNAVQNVLYSETLAEIAKCCAPFDMYQVTELFDPGVPAYRMYILLDLFHMNDDRYRKLLRLRDSGARLLSFYAPAYIDDKGFRPDRLSELAGVNVSGNMQPSAAPDSPVPAFVAPGLAGSTIHTGRSWYCPVPPVPAPELRTILRQAGVHLFMDTGDIVLAGGGYVKVHTATGGDKVLRLPRPGTWKNVRTGECSREPAAEIRFNSAPGRTWLFEVDES